MSGRTRRWIVIGAALVAVVAGLLIWALWPSNPAPRARQYRDFDACLLTDAQGLSGSQARQAWAGMQDASLETRIRVSYLPVAGEATADNAAPYLASLIQRRCRVIVAVGDPQVSAVGAAASRYPAVRFVVLGRPATSAGNVTAVPASTPDAVRSQLKAILTSAAAQG